ncbi:TfpX/TfpZ family type IV pilin accessory protein [Acinetobacter sp. MD2]|uniref:TfpX/TfpZ family type IV pilin accessory protein n=1 Tax=Acinetobacter sp. MD2 TaxID=2600066 RepID=UPI002D1F5040|nr:TfpX/TfpZ family type IV pilin accessory protein [Acinetobacter sp. MD2]MEB3767269.1 type IV pilin accessory protein [Acinetobacter sp. MD2]
MKAYSRMNIFLKYLLISTFMFFITMITVNFIWYPYPLNKILELNHILLIMFLVNIILGPILILVIYKKDRKKLLIDLIIIFSLQMMGLIYGVYTIAKVRPVWIVFSVDRFELVRANEVIENKNIEIKPEYKEKNWLGPKYVAIQLSKNKQQRLSDIFNAINGMTVAKQPHRYINIENIKKDIQHAALPIKCLENYNPKNKIKEIISTYPKADSWLPLESSINDGVVLINKDSLTIISIVNLKPWK